MPFSGGTYTLPWIFGSNQAPTAVGKPGDQPNTSTFPLQLGDNLYDIDNALGLVYAQPKRIASDISIASNATPANLAGLSATVVAGRTYRFEAVIFVKSGAKSGGVKVAISGTATATDVIYDGWAMDTGGTPIEGYSIATALGTAVSDTNTTSDVTSIYIHGTITVNAGGTLTVQGSQNSSNVTATVFGRGSYFTVLDIT